VTGGVVIGQASIRRSFVLPKSLVDEMIAIAPEELRNNLNRLVTTALREYVDAHRRKSFERAMKEMAEDPAIQQELRAIEQDSAETDGDGL
jgi:hypothetical protein